MARKLLTAVVLAAPLLVGQLGFLQLSYASHGGPHEHTINALDMNLSGYVVAPQNPDLVRLPSNTTTGTATALFPFVAGNYLVKFRVMAENDGQPTLKLLVDGEEKCKRTYPHMHPPARTWLECPAHIFADEELLPGSEITLAGTADAQAYAMVKSVVFTLLRVGNQLPSLPPAPTELQARGISDSHIELTWKDNSLDESDFHIERTTYGSSNWTTIAIVPADTTKFTDGSFASCTRFGYRVRSHRHSDNKYSTHGNYTTADCLPAAPSNLQGRYNTPSQISLTWDDNFYDVSHFHIERAYAIELTFTGDYIVRPPNAVEWTEIASRSVTTFSDSSLEANCLDYYYRVRTHYHGTHGDYSKYSNTVLVRCPQPDANTQYELRILFVQSVNTEDRNTDEVYLEIQGAREWGPVEMRNGSREDLSRLVFRFVNPVGLLIEFYDEDGWFDPNDLLFGVTVYDLDGRPPDEDLLVSKKQSRVPIKTGRTHRIDSSISLQVSHYRLDLVIQRTTF